MDYASLLNESQLAAVETKSQYVRIIAGAGSGKTRVLTYRISYLVGEMGVDPRNILAVAFTNKVAREMGDRAAKLVPEAAHFIHVSTFHSFCSRFLREEAHAIGYPVGYTIFDEEDQAKLVKDVCISLEYRKGDDIIKESLNYIRHQKGRGLYPEDITISKNVPHHPHESEWLKIYGGYEDKKRAMYALDFDDLLLQTTYVLKNFERIRQKWQFRIKHILVDEFQDTNDIQYGLIKLLLTPETHLYVVGDPDQTIYTWRGANQKIILAFERDFPNVETIILDRNYRSTDVILKAANKLIAFNKKRVPKNLYTTEENGQPIETFKANTAEGEAQWVSNKIQSIAKKQNGDYSNIAVLYRSSYVTRTFEHQFAHDVIPYRIFGGLRFYQRKEVKDVLAYFRLLTNPLDDVSFDRIVNVPRRGIGGTSLDIIKSEAEACGQSEYNYIKEMDVNKTELGKKAINALTVLVSHIENAKKKLDENLEVYSATLKDFITKLGYYEYLKEEESVNEDRAGNVNSLFDDINNYITHNPESTFNEYLQNVSLLTSQDDINDGNYVSLMTIHVAKGLEFDNVFVISMNDGSFPSNRSVAESESDGLEEERRLCYVAITRAKKKLFLTCNSGYSYVTDTRALPSQFFKEAGAAFPPSQEYSPWEDGYSSYRQRNGWGSSNRGRSSASSFFSDGDAISPFEESKPKAEPKEERPQSNGITDWKVGDIAIHEKFGEGTVTAILSNTIIVVDFASQGKKTLLGTHPLLSRRLSRGGQA